MAARFKVFTTDKIILRKQTGLTMHIDDDSIKAWDRKIYGMIESAAEGAEALVTEASETILDNSREYVPTDTFTLLNSGYVKVHNKSVRNAFTGKAESNFFIGEVGYGDDMQAGVVNPRTGIPASKYAWKVHEDVAASHPNGGQAKFLERAYREYVSMFYGNELITLENSIYTSAKYAAKYSYGDKYKMFHGWSRPTKRIRSKDSLSNNERLDSMPKGTSKGNASWAQPKASTNHSDGLGRYDPDSALYRPIKRKKGGGDYW